MGRKIVQCLRARFEQGYEFHIHVARLPADFYGNFFIGHFLFKNYEFFFQRFIRKGKNLNREQPRVFPDVLRTEARMLPPAILMGGATRAASPGARPG